MIVLCLFIVVSLWFMYSKFSRKTDNNIPGPKPLPIVGNAFDFVTTEPLKKTSQLVKQYGHIVRFWIGTDLFVVLTDPADIEVIVSSTKHILKSKIYQFILPWIGNGLITSHGETWFRHRKFLTPAFHFKILEKSLETIHRNAKILAEKLEVEDGKGEFNIHTYIEKCSLDIICEVAMDVKINAQSSKDENYYLQAIKKISKISNDRMFKPWLQPDILFRIFGEYKLYTKSLHTIVSVSRNVIKMKRKNLQETEKTVESLPENNDEDIKKKEPIPFLNVMLKESNFTDDEIHDEVMNFMFAGHDTTTNCICYCLFELSKHPEIQEKVYDEVMDVLTKDKCPTITDLNKLKYTETVIKETLRLYPIAPAYGRQILEDVKLPSGYTLPANAHLTLFVFGMHRNPDYFPEPEKFIPERFHDDHIRNPFVYLPFSAGPRNCIGQKLAILEVKIVLATLLMNYKVFPSDKTKSLTVAMEVILRAKEGAPVRLVKRV